MIIFEATRIVPAIAALTIGVAISFGQQPVVDPDAPNLIHDRHTHHVNPPHPTEPASDARFFTTRASQIKLPLPTEEEAFSFVVFGDRTGGPADGVNILADAVRDTNLLEPDLVMTVGDLINGYTGTETWLWQMKEFKTIMNQLLCPWFPVAGNHDVYWRPLDDPNKPFGQHDENYEIHFGPLWYSFEHKNCNFIVLYSDEGDPKTGEKNFRSPQAQTVSEEQFKFLNEALERGKDSAHQFIFLHHPRWLAGGYGNDWNERVHPVLKSAGNVTAVFAGHIHYMRSDPKDGIEYLALATVGGGQSGRIPSAGYLHQYHLVTVRPKQVAMAAFPVGEAINVREITGNMITQATLLARQAPKIAGEVVVTESGPQPTTISATVENPTDRPIDFTITPSSGDRNWLFAPDHTHGHVDPGASSTVEFRLDYGQDGLDSGFDSVSLTLAQDYLARTTRYEIPETSATVPIRLDVDVPDSSADIANSSLLLDGRNDALKIPSNRLLLPQGPFTVECWFRARSYSSRVGLLAKTESSEFSIFLSNGRPSSDIHLGGKYRGVRSDKPLATNTWHHIATVYDGSSIAMYVDGDEVDRTDVDPSWKRTTNQLPFYVGADVTRTGEATSFFHGLVDEVRVSKAAVYRENFEPERRLSATNDTVVLYHFDRAIGPIHLDSGPNAVHEQTIGGAGLVPAP